MPRLLLRLVAWGLVWAVAWLLSIPPSWHLLVLLVYVAFSIGMTEQIIKELDL